AISPDGQRGVSTSFAQAIVWDARSGNELFTVSGNHKRWILRAVFSPDNKQIATVGDDRVITLWDAQTGQTLRELKGHEQLVEDVALMPAGDRIATTSRDNTIRLWNVMTGQEISRFPTNSHIRSIVFDGDGHRIFSAGRGGAIDIWDTATGQKLELLNTELS